MKLFRDGCELGRASKQWEKWLSFSAWEHEKILIQLLRENRKENRKGWERCQDKEKLMQWWKAEWCMGEEASEKTLAAGYTRNISEQEWSKFSVLWSGICRLLSSVEFLLLDTAFLYKMILEWKRGAESMGNDPAWVIVTTEVKR